MHHIASQRLAIEIKPYFYVFKVLLKDFFRCRAPAIIEIGRCVICDVDRIGKGSWLGSIRFAYIALSPGLRGRHPSRVCNDSRTTFESVSIVGMGPAGTGDASGSAVAAGSAVAVGSGFKGIMPGSKHDVRKSPPAIITTIVCANILWFS